MKHFQEDDVFHFPTLTKLKPGRNPVLQEDNVDGELELGDADIQDGYVQAENVQEENMQEEYVENKNVQDGDLQDENLQVVRSNLNRSQRRASCVCKSRFFIKKLSGDIILADKGFNIGDLLDNVGVQLNIPTFRISGLQFG